ncbi:uncharacterized protein LOC135804864 [Sycon ciliatum]|uniref:uncharacterized protein LOC135804864 n=1 Tax=Sycon ciliatum TaxID=27933 RepID=UPI0031F6FB36
MTSWWFAINLIMAEISLRRFVGILLVVWIATYRVVSTASNEVLVTVKHASVGEHGFIVARDNVLSSENIQDLRALVLKHSVWRYVGRPAAATPADNADLLGNSGYEKSGWPWLAYMNVSLFKNSAVGGKLLATVEELGNTNTAEGGKFDVEDATAYLIRRGDDSRMTSGSAAGLAADDGQRRSVNVHVELTSGPWKKNDYGETVFYSPHVDDVTGMNEVQEAVHLKPGRVMAWTDGIPFTLRPPSMNKPQWRCGLLVRYSTSADLAREAVSRYEQISKAIEEEQRQEFPPALHPGDSTIPSTGALEKKLTRTFQDSDGKTIAVFDSVWSAEQMEELRRYLLSAHARYRPRLDFSDPDEMKDNARWSAEFEIGSLVKSQYWAVMQKLVTLVSKTSGWYPVGVGLTATHSADDVHIHRNCHVDENEYTLQMYLGNDYPDAIHGETMFYEPMALPSRQQRVRRFGEEGYEMDGPDEDEPEELDEDEMGPGSDGAMAGRSSKARVNYDVIGGVRPRAGRILLFHSSILHSGRPLRADNRTIHYILTVKMARTEQIGKAKTLHAMTPGTEALAETLHSGLQAAGKEAANDGDYVSKHLASAEELGKLIEARESELAASNEKAVQDLHGRL